MIKAIETRYKGYRFRSRLEARYAIFFDELGVEWDYEPEGFDLGELGCYLPDFFLHGNSHYGPYVEVKGIKPTGKEIEKLCTLCRNKSAYGVIVWGAPGENKWLAIDKEGDLTGEEYFTPLWHMIPNLEWEDARIKLPAAVAAARSARFEHGERA